MTAPGRVSGLREGIRIERRLTVVQVEITAADGASSNLEDDVSVLDKLGLVGFD